MADAPLPPLGTSGDELPADRGASGPTLTALNGGRPPEAALHPAGSARSRWAQQELGDLLGPTWTDTADPSPAPPPPDPPAGGAIWEVERMPSEAEGGVVGLLLSGRRDEPPAVPADRVASAWDGATTDTPASGLARLAEMLDHLPTDTVTRLTPDDMDVATPSPAPPAVWFWGDDDIYPGKVAGVVEARPTGKRHLRRSA